MGDRTVLRASGADVRKFLQDLVTNDLNGLENGLVYAALLTPQGKYLVDFFLVPDAAGILIDVAADHAPGLVQRLTMYKLRADVVIEAAEIEVVRGVADAPATAFADPRHEALGWRDYSGQAVAQDVDWDALRVAYCVPETGVELFPNQSYILECGFDRLNGVDFKKGCYVGQEVTARMKHKTELRKGLASVSLGGEVPVGSEIVAAGKSVGHVFTQSGGRGIAYLRFDRAGEEMEAAGVTVTL